jgi:hypothetical protein
MSKMKNLIKIRNMVILKMMTSILTLTNRSKLKKKKKNSMEVARKKEKLRLLDQHLQESNIMRSQFSNMKIRKK